MGAAGRGEGTQVVKSVLCLTRARHAEAPSSYPDRPRALSGAAPSVEEVVRLRGGLHHGTHLSSSSEFTLTPVSLGSGKNGTQRLGLTLQCCHQGRCASVQCYRWCREVPAWPRRHRMWALSPAMFSRSQVCD